jgi:hypothetical protein
MSLIHMQIVDFLHVIDYELFVKIEFVHFSMCRPYHGVES